MPKVIKNADKPESKEILAEAIVRIGDSLNALSKGGLNEKAIIALVQDHSGVNKGQIITVLNSLRQLRGYYCR